jgi:hypothetical protein
MGRRRELEKNRKVGKNGERRKEKRRSGILQN